MDFCVVILTYRKSRSQSRSPKGKENKENYIELSNQFKAQAKSTPQKTKSTPQKGPRMMPIDAQYIGDDFLLTLSSLDLKENRCECLCDVFRIFAFFLRCFQNFCDFDFFDICIIRFFTSINSFPASRGHKTKWPLCVRLIDRSCYKTCPSG